MGLYQSKLKLLLVVGLALAGAQLPVKAGCAIAFEVKAKGSYFTRSVNSSDPKFGHHYSTVDQAVALLMDELKKAGATDAKVVFKSDQTGYFSIAIGHAADGTYLNHVGCASDPRAADKQALAGLKAQGVTDGAVAQRFFFYGDPAAGGPGGSPHH